MQTDLAGPFKPRAIYGHIRYNLVFGDDYSRKSWSVPLTTKYGVNKEMKKWILLQENQRGKMFKKLRLDNGGEFVNGEMTTWLDDKGVHHQKIPKESPQSNGVAKRMNRTLQDRARSMLIGSGLGGGFWVEDTGSASHIRNRGVVRILSKTPEKLWSGKFPTIKHLKAYGPKAYVSLEKHKRKGKMGSTLWEGVVVGHPIDNVGYRVWDPVRGQIFNTGVPTFDKTVELGWWRKEKVGLPAQDDSEAFVFPNLEDGGGLAVEDEAHQEEDDESLPILVEDSSDDDDDDEDGDEGGGGFGWGPEDDAPLLPPHGGPPDEVGAGGNAGEGGGGGKAVGGGGGPAAEAGSLAANGDGGQGGSGGGASAAAAALGVATRQSNRSNLGVPPIRFIEMYLAAAAKQEAK